MDVKVLNDLNLKTLSSTECKLYIDKAVIYKVFNSDIDIKERIDIVNIFLNNDIKFCPKIYDFIYDNNEIIGYMMEYYKRAKPLSDSSRFNFLKDKCIELIDTYLYLKDNYNICYQDFQRSNVFTNKGKILLLDVDGCIKKTYESEQNSTRLIINYILGIIYKTYFFDFMVYYTVEEREKMKKLLYTNFNDLSIQTIDDIRYFVRNVSKADTKKILKKGNYNY